MRSLSYLAVAVAALTTIACGSAAPEAGNVSGGNVYVSEALEATDGVANADSPFRLVSVAVDSSDLGCTVDGVRYDSCILSTTSTADFRGPVNLCELAVDQGDSYLWECGISAENLLEEGSGIERLQEMPSHCPSGR